MFNYSFSPSYSVLIHLSAVLKDQLQSMLSSANAATRIKHIF